MSGNHTSTPWVYVHESTEYGVGDDDVTFGYLMQAGDAQYQIAPMIVDTIDGRANAEFIVTAVNSYASSQAEIERLRRKLTNCVHALTFAINGWDESDPFIQKLRATRDGAQAALSGSKE